MVHITGQVRSAAPAEEVFDTVADSRNEPSYNPAMVAAALLTPLSWDWVVHPRGWLRMLGPLLGPLGSRMEHKIWTGLKRHLEARGHPLG